MLWNEKQIQRIINSEIVLILIAVGIDILIEAIGANDWIASAVIIAGFCMIIGLYWHSRHLDRFLKDVHAAIHHLSRAADTTISVPATIPLPATFRDQSLRDIPLASIADRPIIRVSNYHKGKEFYSRALSPLGYAITMDFPSMSMTALGIGMASDLWIKKDTVEHRMKCSFAADSSRIVDNFFEAALEAGGKEVESPGTRIENSTRIYSATVVDPDGYTIEAMYREDSGELTIA